MKVISFVRKLVGGIILVHATAGWAADTIDVVKFQPPIVSNIAPEIQFNWSIKNNAQRTHLKMFEPIVPAYDGKGSLLASWNPMPGNLGEHITLIVGHGGHGVTPGEFATASWAQQTLGANVLILDSFWSRGIKENWQTWTKYGANMRMLDGLAAARFTRAKGADPAKTFYYGDSQGGWTALRLFSKHDHADEVLALYKGSIAAYPNCYVKGFFGPAIPNGQTDSDFAPPLGEYVGPVIVFTGTNDDATPVSQCKPEKVLQTTEKWVVFEGATHAWDNPNRGAGRPAVDGECERVKNIYNPFKVCRSDKYTDQMHEDMRAFLHKHASENEGPVK